MSLNNSCFSSSASWFKQITKTQPGVPSFRGMYFRPGQELNRWKRKETNRNGFQSVEVWIPVKWPPQKHRLTLTCSTTILSAHRQTRKCVKTMTTHWLQRAKGILFSPNTHTLILVYNTVILVHTLSVSKSR